MKLKEVNLDNKSSFWGSTGRIIGGGLKNAVDTAISSPYHFDKAIQRAPFEVTNNIASVLGYEKPFQQEQDFFTPKAAPSIKVLEPQGKGEAYGQHAVENLALMGLTGGLNPLKGVKPLQKTVSAIKSVGSGLGDIAAADIGQHFGEKIAGPVGGAVGSVLGVGLKRGTNTNTLKENFQPIKKKLYQAVKKEGFEHIASGDINELVNDFLETEQRRDPSSKFIRRLSNWENQSKNNTIKANDLHDIKKDLNQYIYKEYGSPDYLSALEREVHQVIDKAGKTARNPTNLTLPNWTSNLRKADLLHKIFSEPKSTNNPLKQVWNYISRKFTPTKFIIDQTGRRLLTPLRLGASLPSETADFFSRQITKALEEHPSLFQGEIKKINKELDKEVPTKKKFKEITL